MISGEQEMPTIKTIGKSGQISLGKEYAGQHASVAEIEPGVWIIKLGDFVPHSEQWLHASEPAADLHKAITWAEENPPRKTNWVELERRLKK
jgi:hypothetical protein